MSSIAMRHPMARLLRPGREATTACPGCGDGIIAHSVLRAVDELGLDLDEFVFVCGIGCAGWIPSPYFAADTLHTTHGRPVAFATAPASIRSGCLREDSEVLEEGLISRLAVAVSILVQHTELTQAGDKDPGAELLEAVRDSCLAVIETVWLKDLNNAYDASRRRRETLFKRCGSVADLRERIHQEDAHLREDMARLSTRLEEMLAATDGRYAKASVNLTAALRRMLG